MNCLPLLHNYNKWTDYKQYVSEKQGKVILVQKRTCKICGKTKLCSEET
jgi:hypothetical protein